MKFFTAIIVAATAVVAQQIGSEEGPSVASGPSAVSNPNVNNGWQAQNSLFNSGSDGGNVFEHLTGNTFNKAVSNSATNDNNFVNPSQVHVSGNTGPTTNGEGNHIGDVFSDGFRGFGGFGGFHKRDAVFNNYGFGHGYAGYPAVYGGYHPQVASVYPVPYQPIAYAPARPVAYAPIARPVVGYPGYPASRVNHNVQNASIVQNQA
ncbi:hypothetical protein GGI07_002608 [Coemansia sp. Benny D115]|nr:hypothetical protein GGI07_002608 [Coemansia sp. Benny D115]